MLTIAIILFLILLGLIGIDRILLRYINRLEKIKDKFENSEKRRI